VNELTRFRLDGRVAFVAGGSGGIGVRLCEAFAGVGANVAIVGRSAEGLRAASEAVEAAGGEALVLTGDMTKEADADRVVAETVDTWGRLDAVVNAIGGGAGTALYPAQDYPESEWDRIVDLNLRSQFLVSKAAARAMIAAGNGGRILNISSVRGQLGIDNGFSAYVAAKGAMNALTRQHATEWAKHGITVNAISPTFVRTPQVEDLLADESFTTALYKRIPLGRIAETDDLVGAALFFCSDASGFVTGQLLTLDGGLTATQ
jgi:gluconate 5-dehydrogenase